MRKFVKGLLWFAAIVAALIGLARLTVLRWVRLPANDPVLEASLLPTLEGGDLVLLWRGTQPGFGDLAMCPEPGTPARFVLARIVGEPGDRVKLEEGRLSINGKFAETETACGVPRFKTRDPHSGAEVEQTCWIESLGGTSHPRGNPFQDRSRSKVMTERVVPAGKFWLLSDNRQYPYDSRDFGPVDSATCKEFVFFRLVSRRGFFDVDRRLTYVP